jgi:hypothetical protein
VQARDTAFSSTLSGFRPGSSATFFDVSYPSLDVVPSAIVTTFHKLSIRALDINQNTVTEGTYSIRSVPGGADAGSGPLSALIQKDLEASRIAQGFETFTGNYKVTVNASGGGGGTIVRDVVMDRARNEQFGFEAEIVAPSSIEIEVAAQPSSLYHGAQVELVGSLLVFYPNRLQPLTRAAIMVTIDGGEGVSASAVTEANGSFTWVGAFAPTDQSPGVRQVNVSASYAGAFAARSLTIEVLKPAPSGLVVRLDDDSIRFTPAVGQSFIVHGEARYTDAAGNPTDPAANVLVQALFVNPFQPDAPPSARTDSNGRFTMTILGRNAPKSYSINVVAHDDATGFNAPAQQVTAVVGAGAATAPVSSGLTLYILIAAIAGIGGLIGFLVINAKRKSVNYVECGNCGRPAHEGDKKCPSCGCEFEEDIAKCSHCASWIPANAVRCPKCNTEFKPIGEALEAPTAAPDKAAPEGVKAEVTTTAEPVKAPVAVKKKVLKTAEPAKPEGGEQKFENPWDKPKDAAPAAPAPAEQKPAEKKPEEKKEKGLFDDL